MIIDRLLVYVVGVLAALAMLGSLVLGVKLHFARVELTACQTKNDALSAAIERQNASIQVAESAASAAQANGAAALLVAKQATQLQKAPIAELKAAILAGASKDCGPAISKIREGLRP